MIGISDGMVMQRNEKDVSEIFVSGISEIEVATYSGVVSGSIEVIRTEEGWKLIGIPVGGPYTVTINKQVFQDIYVGDLWILAGQSNMQGVGWLTKEDEEYQGDERIRTFYMQDEWGVARHRLHRPWLAVDKVHTEVIKASPGKEPEKVGVGPGLSFAQHMEEYTKVPQGVICCAHGGTTMAQWNPEIAKDGPDKSLFAAMVRRFKVNGSHVRGMFWYQGCSEAMAHLNEIFFSNMQRFVAATRAEMGMIPIVQVQIGNITVVEREHWDRTWTDIREQQRTMSDEFPLFDTISAISMATDDAVHLSSDSQKSIGKTAAESMYALMMDDKEFLLAPKYKSHKVYSAWMEEYTIIDVEYENVYGELQADGKPYGFEISNATDHLTHKQVCNISLEGNHVLIRVGRNISQLEDWYLFYGFGVNPYCNITDSHGRRIPAMGPIKII